MSMLLFSIQMQVTRIDKLQKVNKIKNHNLINKWIWPFFLKYNLKFAFKK